MFSHFRGQFPSGDFSPIHPERTESLKSEWFTFSQSILCQQENSTGPMMCSFHAWGFLDGQTDISGGETQHFSSGDRQPSQRMLRTNKYNQTHTSLTLLIKSKSCHAYTHAGHILDGLCPFLLAFRLKAAMIGFVVIASHTVCAWVASSPTEQPLEL